MNIQTRLDNGKRQELGEKLPLDTPYVLLIEPSSLCNMRCKWCPTGYDDLIKQNSVKPTIMKLEDYKKVIDDVHEFGEKIRVLRLYKNGEPLINPNFDQMVKYAKDSGNFLRIDTTTNGMLLEPELNRKIISAGIDQINISVNGMSAEQICKNTGRKIDFSKFVENIKDLYRCKEQCTIYIKCIQDILTKEEQQQFYDLFGEISDRIFLERLSPAWPAFDVSKSGYYYDNIGNYNQPIENRQVCPYIFYIMVVNADGTVSSCVGDWPHKQILGNLLEDNVVDVWKNGKLKNMQVNHLKMEKDLYVLCSNCKVISHGCYDNIDIYAKKILEELE